jgi:predicted amino acid racemase
VLGAPEIAHELLRAGVARLGDSRIENLEALRRHGVVAPLVLVRSPAPSQVERVVAAADVSCNTELSVLDLLSVAACAQDRVHGVLLMVELGDLREGILPGDLPTAARHVLGLPGLRLEGIGANLACQSGVIPDAAKMAELSALADALESDLGIRLAVVSGGSSANLPWALTAAELGRIDDLRIGEAILLGCEPLHRTPIDGLYTDAVRLVAEVIESKHKPSLPWGELAETAFGDRRSVADRGVISQAILAIGRLDVEPDGLTPPTGITVLGASSDHLVVESTAGLLAVGAELAFRPDYAALLRAMASPFVATVFQRAPADAGSAARR